MRTPTTPNTPYAYSASATSPLHLDIHIPLVLLGPRMMAPELAKGPERHENRLKLLHGDLLTASGIRIALWQHTLFDEWLADGALEEEDDAFEGKKAEWQRAEQNRWDEVSHNGGWIIRATPGHPKPSPDSSGRDPSATEPVGMSPHWRRGDGLLTEREAQLAFSNNIWTLPFTLQRFDLLSSRREDWEREVREVMDALSDMSRADIWENPEHPEHPDIERRITIVAAERCHPHVTFRQASSLGGASTPWDDYTVQNVLLLMTAFEREMATLATPEFLLAYRPLTDCFVAREVKRMRRARRALWKGLNKAMGDGEDEGGLEGGRRIRKQRLLNRKVREWRGEMEREDENILRREALLGEEGTPWWEYLHQAMEEGSVDDLVSDITLRTAKTKGRRLALGLGIQTQDVSHIPSTHNHNQKQSSSPDPDPEPIPDDRPAPHHTRTLTQLSLPPSPPPPNSLPKITTIIFPVALRSLSPVPFLAYTSLLSSLLHFATENDTDDVYDYVRAAKTGGKRAGETGIEGFVRLVERMGVREEGVRVLSREAVRFALDKDGDGDGVVEKEGDMFRKVERFVEDRYKEGRRFVCGDGDGAVGGDRNGDRGRQIKTSLRYLGRYEAVGGFLVPGRVKVLGLLEAGRTG
ncbi:hypothetical protein P171DRAFT_444625 [Karstenula rhodostoma CBS 690.94]|uniref:Uncharacterized protein n=1 Tax=Karstenula rhodostoma CBS 690.94 TaxID=1392251 RepID=A0A9P4PIA0_9PLEO|nr:hypothetical protein P171DRAFT_444625 [Karstenula rhodostoma CBS 690.94]